MSGCRCDNCGQDFPNVYQLGPHRRMCFNRQAPLYDNFSSDDDSAVSAASASAASAASGGSAHEERVNILSLARRLPASEKWGIEQKVVCSSTTRYDPHYTADYTEVNMCV